MPYLILIVVAGAAALFVPGSPLKLGKSAVQKEKLSAAVVVAQKDLLAHEAQRAVNQTNYAVTGLPDSTQKKIALSFAAEASSLLGQIYGTPTSSDLLAWQKVVENLESENAELRTQGVRDRAAEQAVTADLSKRLGQAIALHARDQAAVNQYAEESTVWIGWKDRVLFWGGLVLLLWILMHATGALSLAVPALSGVSTLLHSIFAPFHAISLLNAKNESKELLNRAGTALGELRVELPQVAGNITRKFDQVFDVSHHELISPVATQAEKDALYESRPELKAG